jgi:hypothetical protein
MKRSLRLRFFLAAMPLLAGLHEAFTATARHVEQQQGIHWFSTFCGEVAVRLPISVVLAVAIFALVSAADALLFKLGSVSVSAQAARHNIDLKKSRQSLPILSKGSLPRGESRACAASSWDASPDYGGGGVEQSDRVEENKARRYCL